MYVYYISVCDVPQNVDLLNNSARLYLIASNISIISNGDLHLCGIT